MDEKKKTTEAQISEVTCSATRGHMCGVEGKKGQREERNKRGREEDLRSGLSEGSENFF